jgi:hypothetical protein
MRYYYTPDGTQVFGPVEVEILGQLGREGLLHASSFICPEGETEWKPFALAAVSKPAPPPPVATFGPAPSTPKRVRPTVVADDGEGEKGWIAIILNLVTVYAALRGLVHYVVRPPRWVQGDDPNARTWTELAIGVFVLVVVPWWFSLLFKGLNRVIVRTVGIVILACAMEVIYYMPQTPEEDLAAKEQAMSDKLMKDARKAVDGRGNLKDTREEARADIQKMSAMATDDSETSRATRALVEVEKEIGAKVKIGEAAFANCDFDPTTITGTDDIAQRRANFLTYRQTQADVLEDARTFRPRLRQALINENVSSDYINESMSDPQTAKRFEIMVSLWQDRVKAADDQIARLDFLNQTYGTWNVTDGKLIFHDQASLNSYNALVQGLQADANAIQDEAKQYVQ